MNDRQFELLIATLNTQSHYLSVICEKLDLMHEDIKDATSAQRQLAACVRTIEEPSE